MTSTSSARIVPAILRRAATSNERYPLTAAGAPGIGNACLMTELGRRDVGTAPRPTLSRGKPIGTGSVTLRVRTVNASEAKARLAPSAWKDAVRRAFAGLATGHSVQPTQITAPFPDGAGDCIFYAGLLYDLGLVGVKASPYICAAEREGRSAVTAYTLLF